MSLVDANARAAIADALDETLIVEAAAGTGKTTELVRRILRVLETGRATMVEIVAVTFTEKAAGELKLRLREALEKARADAEASGSVDVKARLDLALETLEEAHVNTIHGFCADLLRERPVEATVDPLFAVLTEAQAARLYSRAFRDWLQAALQDPSEGVRRALRRTSGGAFFGGSSDGPIDRLRNAGRQLAEGRDFPASWTRRPFDRTGEIERLIGLLHAFADLTGTPASERDNLFVDTAGVRRLSRQVRLEQSFGHVEHDAWEARLVDLVRDRGFSRPRKGTGYKFGPSSSRTDVLAARDRLFGDLQQFRKDADADLAACLQGELAGATATYQALKSAAGVLDFADLLARARDLLKANASVRLHLQQKFRRIFVDEFQDTDPVQAEILLLLAADDPDVSRWEHVRPRPGKLFIVGDPKQAIYRFRGTDVGTYWRVGRHLEAQGGRVVRLTTSYRSVPGIQRFVNAAFAPVMVANDTTLQADYVPLSPSRPALGSQPSVVALPVPRPYSGRGPLRPSAKAIDESLPDAIGAFIAWLTDPKHGWTVAGGVPLQPKHIAVLFRRFSSFGEDITRKYTDAMEARGVPHLLVGGKSFHGREEVETMRAALAAIEWPDDELSVFATLKGSLFAIDDAHLLEFRHRFRRLHSFRVPKELGGNSGQELVLTAEPTSHLQPIADVLRLLQQLHRQRNYRPVADTVSRLLAETRAHVGFILRPAGEQALANVLHVAELARQYEAGGGISFRGFIDELRSAAESEAAEAPILEESSDGVRLMTVHKAKGLEFPVVILADLTCRMSRGDASRYLDADRQLLAMKIGGWAPHELHEHEAEEVARDEAEGVRLAYVAATRARDLLVVPALGDGAWDGGWFAPLNAPLYPATSARRTAARGPGCPPFTSKDTVLERPNDEMAGPFTVCPGLHAFEGGEAAVGYDVVWWDPGTLALGAKTSFGVRRDDLIVKDVSRHVVADGRGRYDRWRLSRADALDAGKVPSIEVRTARERTADGQLPLDLLGQVGQVGLVGQVVPFDFAQGRQVGGAAYGVLVHAVLALTPFDTDADHLRALATSEARVLGLSEVDAAQAAMSVERVLTHDLLVRARAAEARGACRRETPVTVLLPEGTLVEGVVDLAFEEQGTWTVVDYKTDRELATDDIERYRRQVAIYMHAIATATGQPASGVILQV